MSGGKAGTYKVIYLRDQNMGKDKMAYNIILILGKSYQILDFKYLLAKNVKVLMLIYI